MPEDLDELKKYENLSESESNIVKILEKDEGKALTFAELADLFYSRKQYKVKSYKDILIKLGITFTENLSLNFVLENLLKKDKIHKIFAKGKEYYFIKLE